MEEGAWICREERVLVEELKEGGKGEWEEK